MGAVVITVPIAMLSGLLFHFVSLDVAAWFAWGCLTLWNLFSLYRNIQLRRAMKEGGSFSTGEIVAAASQPFVVGCMLVAALVVLVLDYSKFHLLWLYPVLNILFDYTAGSIALKKVDPDFFRK
jgi:hypothetical protein